MPITLRQSSYWCGMPKQTCLDGLTREKDAGRPAQRYRMFKKVLIANRGDQPLLSGAAAKPNCVLTVGQASDFATEVLYV